MLKVKGILNLRKISTPIARLLSNKQKFRLYSSASASNSNIEITNDSNSLETKFQNLISDEIKKNQVVPIFKKILAYNHSIAIKDNNGEFSYAQIYMAAKKLSIQISNLCGK